MALKKDFFVEVSWDEALAFIEKKEKTLTKDGEQLTKRSCEIKAHILFV